MRDVSVRRSGNDPTVGTMVIEYNSNYAALVLFF